MDRPLQCRLLHPGHRRNRRLRRARHLRRNRRLRRARRLQQSPPWAKLTTFPPPSKGAAHAVSTYLTEARLFSAALTLVLVGCSSSTLPLSPGPTNFLSLQPSRLSLTTTGNSKSATVTLTDGTTGGAISESDNCLSSRIASVSTPRQVMPQVSSYTIAALGAGSCAVTFRNLSGSTAQLQIVINAG